LTGGEGEVFQERGNMSPVFHENPGVKREKKKNGKRHSSPLLRGREKKNPSLSSQIFTQHKGRKKIAKEKICL